MMIVLLFSEKFESIHKAPKFKIVEKVRITKCKNIFSKGYTNNWSRKTIVIDSVIEANPWTYKMKELNGETTIESFYEKELLLSKLLMSSCLKPDSHIRNSIKVVLDLTNYATKNN